MAARDTDGDEERLPGVGDEREKHVVVLTDRGERIEHDASYLRYTDGAFLVSTDETFPEPATTRYRKTDLARLEVRQHHSTCFITTAAVGDGATLDALRGFRDDALEPSFPGRALVGVYDAVSPPVARTLERYPNARTTRFVGWLVERCGTLARVRERRGGPARAAISMLLTVLYVVGVCCAVAGHLGIRLRELTA